jgi:hypothetical protein
VVVDGALYAIRGIGQTEIRLFEVVLQISHDFSPALRRQGVKNILDGYQGEQIRVSFFHSDSHAQIIPGRPGDHPYALQVLTQLTSTAGLSFNKTGRLKYQLDLHGRYLNKFNLNFSLT